MTCQNGSLEFTAAFNGSAVNNYLLNGSLANSYAFDGALTAASLFNGVSSSVAEFIGKVEVVCKQFSPEPPPAPGPPSGWVGFPAPSGAGNGSYHTNNSSPQSGSFVITANPSVGDDVSYSFANDTLVFTLIGLGAQIPHNTAGSLVIMPSGVPLAIRGAFGSAWEYISGTDSWTITGSETHDGDTWASCEGGPIANQDAYRFGGRDRNSGFTTNTVETYNKSLGTWSALNNFPISFQGGQATLLRYGPKAGFILVGGGATSGPTTNQRWWFYDPSTDTYEETTSSTTGTYSDSPIGNIQLLNGLCYTAGGGSTYNGSSVNMTNTFDPATETWARESTGNLPFAVDSDTASMLYYTDGTVYIIRSPTSYYGTFS
jgi:hypothetical protein